MCPTIAAKGGILAVPEHALPGQSTSIVVFFDLFSNSPRDPRWRITYNASPGL